MVASELGEIPEGWRVGTLGEMIEINTVLPLRVNSLQPKKQKTFYYLLVTLELVEDSTQPNTNISNIVIFPMSICWKKGP